MHRRGNRVRSAREVQERLLRGGGTHAEFPELCRYALGGRGIPGKGNIMRTRRGHVQGEQSRGKDGQGIGMP